jgi:hypothetical protein
LDEDLEGSWLAIRQSKLVLDAFLEGPVTSCAEELRVVTEQGFRTFQVAQFVSVPTITSIEIPSSLTRFSGIFERDHQVNLQREQYSLIFKSQLLHFGFASCHSAAA